MNDDLFGDIEAFLKENPEKEELLTDKEVQAVILSLAVSRGSKPFTEEEATKVVEWASTVRLEMTLLDLVLKGLVGVDISSDGEVLFGLSTEGKLLHDFYENN